MIKSYSSEKAPLLTLAREAYGLYRYSKKIPERVQALIEDARRVEVLLNERFGLKLRDLDILEIGPGQFFCQMVYLAAQNRVVGIDLDLIAQGFSPITYVRMLQENGLRRTVKTIGRKMLGVDRRFAAEMRRQLGLPRRPSLNVLQMDACRMDFPDESFDLVYARSVFHHLPDPGAALDGIVRVLKPGGAVYILLHLFTSQTGCLDPRVYTERWSEMRGWPHLRPQLQNTLANQNTYVNMLRLHKWRELFAEKMAGAEYIMYRSDPSTIEMAESLQRSGELMDYSIEELTTVGLAVVWKKPLIS
jgi:SAM-dependent methyltransferase